MANLPGKLRVVLLVLYPAVAWSQSEPVVSTLLEDFSRPVALEAWKLVRIEAAVDSLTATARLHFPVWAPGQYQWPAAVLEYGQGLFVERDWGQYDTLRFQVRNETDKSAKLALRLDDAAGQRFTRTFSVPAQQDYTCQVDIGELEGRINAAQVVHFNLFMSRPPADYTLHLGPIRLEAGALSVESAQLLNDPFLRGRVALQARSRRRVLWHIEVANAAGQVVAQHAEAASRLQWRLRTRLEPGEYRVDLQVRDTTWTGEHSQRPLGRFNVVESEKQPDWVLWHEPSTRKILHHSQPRVDQVVYDAAALAGGQGPPLRLHMGRNESEALQVVLLTRRRGAEFRLQLDSLYQVDSGAPFPLRQSRIYQVGYVRTKAPKEYGVDHVGWWPDPLLATDSLQVLPGECAPVWVALQTHSDTPTGLYRGGLRVQVDGVSVGVLPMEVEVHQAVLPDSTRMRTAFSFYDSEVRRLYGDQADFMAPKYRAFIAARRLNVDNIYRRSPPLLAPLDSLERAGRLNAFNMGYLSANSKYGPVELRRLGARLDSLLARGRPGLIEKAYIYGFDEVGPAHFAQIQQVFSFIKRHYPQIQTMTTARDPSYGQTNGLDDVVDIWVPLTAAYERAAAAAARARGAQIWWYICIAPLRPYANWFIEYSALEARLLWWMAYQEDIDGFLYYTMNRWRQQDQLLQLSGGNRTNWNPASFGTANGDGYLFYAGADGPVSSIRLENIRDGIEDHQLLHMLAVERGDGGLHSRALAAQLASSPTDFSRDEQHFSQVRLELLEAFIRPGLWPALKRWWTQFWGD